MSDLADGFEQHRGHLESVAYRMLGSRAEAEDAVQEAWLRYAGADRSAIRDTRGWLTTTTARICLDVLRSARVRREAYVGSWLPEPIVSRLPGPGGLDSFAPDPADRATRTDELSYALLVIMEKLTPEQRVAFVLHDVFAVPFDAIAAVLSTTDAAARQLASRARRAVGTDSGPPRRDLAAQAPVVKAFLAAAQSGDIDGLLTVLAPDAVVVGDGGGVAPVTKHPVEGALQAARFVAGLFRRTAKETEHILVEPVLLNGDLGLLVELTLPSGEQQRLTIGFAYAGGRIGAVFNQVNPAKVAALPPVDPDRALR